MNRTPLILGAIAVASCLGVAVGATVPTEPLSHMRSAAIAEIPRHDSALLDYEDAAKPTPNHYPLETPEGRIEVAQLSDYGLYRNRRYNMQYDASAYAEVEYEPAGYESAIDPLELDRPAEVAESPLSRDPLSSGEVIRLDAPDPGLVAVDTAPSA